jgi:benzoyl-CoA reductase/2-hydroxyglutaryl-CoA dehydratase subunit BcrC/BadD/HgdB
MKIELLNGHILDTEKLSDKEAAIHEAMNNLFEVCKKYGISAFATAVVGKERFIHMKSITKNPNDEVKIDEYNTLFASINKFLQESSDGKVKIFVD